jgi:hypothetical protein
MEYIRRCWMHSRAQPVPLQVHARSPSRSSSHSRKSSLGHARNPSSTSVRSVRSRSASVGHSRQGSANSVVPVRSRASSDAEIRSLQPLQVDTNALHSTSAPSPTEDAAFSPQSKPAKAASCWDLSIFGGDGTAGKTAAQSTLSPLSPRRRKALERAKLEKRLTRLVSSPFPYILLAMLALMVVMIFIDVMPISGLICVFAISMIIVVVLGNHYLNKQIWIEEEDADDEVMQPMGHPSQQVQLALGPGSAYAPSGAAVGEHLEAGQQGLLSGKSHDEDLGPLTYEDRLDSLNQFFEALFASIDYSLLIIFLGLFIVVDNVASTGLPKSVWARIVGHTPFATAASIAGISAVVLLVSQFLGNVAVIKLAKPHVEGLDDNTKRLAWAIISFVATVGGNLTITGSAGTCHPMFWVLLRGN